MIFPIVKKYRLVFDFLQLRKVCPIYEGVRNTTTDEIVRSNEIAPDEHSSNTIYVVNYIPPFLEPQIRQADKRRLKAITMNYFYGFMADLRNQSTLDDYLKEKMSSKSRTKVKSYVRKLEACYPISYKLYFGEISSAHYDFLFSKFQEFLKSRFLQRGDTHELLPHWKSIRQDSYEMIRNKTASLFVIYNDKEPIDICLNYHTGNVMHNGIRSYDIAYSKFRLGYIDILKQLQWCFENGIHLFDLGVGDMDYKRHWCNVIYDFEHQIHYRKGKAWVKLVAITLARFYETKEYLKKKELHKFYHKIRKLFKKTTNRPELNKEKKMEILSDGPSSDQKSMTPLDLKDEANFLMKKSVCDFQYAYLEPSNEINVYKLNEDSEVYLIKGKTNEQWLRMI